MKCPKCFHDENSITPRCASCSYIFTLGEILRALINERGERVLLKANVLKSLIDDLCVDKSYDKLVLNALLSQGFGKQILELSHMSGFKKSALVYEQNLSKTFNIDKVHYIVNSFYYALTGECLPVKTQSMSKRKSISGSSDIFAVVQTIPTKVKKYIKSITNYFRTSFGNSAAIKKRLPQICGILCLLLFITGVLIFTKSLYTKYKISHIISEADTLAMEQDFEGALSTIRSGKISYPNSQDLEIKETEYANALYIQIKENMLSDVAELIESGDYKSAFSRLREVKNKYSNDTDYNNAYSNYYNSYKSNIVSNADSIADSGDYIGAMNIIGNAIDILGSDNDLENKRKLLEDTYVENLLQQSDALIEQRKFSEAETYIESASDNLPNNEKLINQKNNISKLKFSAEIVKKYSGYYIKSDNTSYTSVNELYGFDLEIKSCDINGIINAVFSFYSLDDSNNIFGSYKMNGNITDKQDNGKCLATLKGTEWIVQPSWFHMLDFDITFNADRTIITSEANHIFGVDTKASGIYSCPGIEKNYTGTYMPSWGVSCLDIKILSYNENTGKVNAEFYFYPHEHNPDGRTGRFTMKGNIVNKYPDGSIVILLKGDEWIDRPSYTVMLDFFVTIDGKHSSMISDCDQINLTAK